MNDISSIKTVRDIIENADLIIRTAEISPIFDPIIEISINDDVKDINVILMGGAIRANFLSLLRSEQQKVDKGCGKYLKLAPNIDINDDTNLYFLRDVNLININCNIKNIIHTKDPINLLVVNKYLPCNRIATNNKQNTFWVSLQCLYSLLTGNCFMPMYLRTIDEFISIIRSRECHTINISSFKNIFKNIRSEIEIHKNEGYTFSYIETKTILPCIMKELSK